MNPEETPAQQADAGIALDPLTCTAHQEPKPGPSFSLGRIGVIFAWLAALSLVAIGTWSDYEADLRGDQYQLIGLGETVYHGGRMYADCWENKPPGIAWLNALTIALAGGNQLGAWILPGVVAAAVLVVFYLAARRLSSAPAFGFHAGRLPACVGLLLVAGVYSVREYDTPSINPDFYASMLELAGASLAILAFTQKGRDASERLANDQDGRRGTVLLCFGAGLLFAMAAGVKQTGLVTFLLLAMAALAAAIWRVQADTRVRRCAAVVAAGFAVGVGAIVAVLIHQGTLREAWQAAFVPYNSGLSPGSMRANVLGSLLGWRNLQPLALPLWLAALGLLAPFRRPLMSRGPLLLVIAVAGWWLAQALLVRFGPSQSMRYWQATFPPMLLLAVLGIALLQTAWRELRTGSRHVVMLTVATAAFLLSDPLLDDWKLGVSQSYVSSTEPDRERDRLRNIGDRLQAIVPPAEPIYLCAYESGVYLYAERQPACRFTYPRTREQAQEILAALSGGRAYAILVPRAPHSSFETYGGAAWREGLAAVLTHYTRVESVPGYEIWVRKQP